MVIVQARISLTITSTSNFASHCSATEPSALLTAETTTISLPSGKTAHIIEATSMKHYKYTPSLFIIRKPKIHSRISFNSPPTL